MLKMCKQLCYEMFLQDYKRDKVECQNVGRGKTNLCLQYTRLIFPA